MDPTLKCFEFLRQHFSQYQSDKMSYQIGTWKLYWISFFLDNYFCFDLGFEPMWIRQRRENSKHSSYPEPSIGKRSLNNGKFVLKSLLWNTTWTSLSVRHSVWGLSILWFYFDSIILPTPKIATNSAGEWQNVSSPSELVASRCAWTQRGRFSQRLDKVQISGGARSVKNPENAWFSCLGGAKSTKNA